MQRILLSGGHPGGCSPDWPNDRVGEGYIVKVKLEYEDKEHGSVVEMNTAPRVGERLMTASGETMEIIQVVHTPTSEECAVFVVLRKAQEDDFAN